MFRCKSNGVIYYTSTTAEIHIIHTTVGLYYLLISYKYYYLLRYTTIILERRCRNFLRRDDEKKTERLAVPTKYDVVDERKQNSYRSHVFYFPVEKSMNSAHNV